MPHLTTTFVEKKVFPGTSKKTGKPYVKIVFEAQDGTEYSTFDGNLASKAEALLNAPVVVEYETWTSDNGKFTNCDLKDVAPATNGDVYGAGTNNSAPQTSSNGLSGHSDKDERITRAVALKAAMEAFGIAGQDPILARDEVIEYAETLLPWLHTGEDL